MIGRRGLIASAVLFAAGLLGRWRRAGAGAVFPPGASVDFPARCIRCQRCAQACPVEAIRIGPISTSPSLAELPVLKPQSTACILCMKCTEVCPTGALSPITAELGAIRAQVKMGLAILDRKACLTHARRGSCRLCFEVCPFAGEAIILSGLGQGPAIMAEACVGCGRCAEACPSSSKAIEIVPLGGGRR